MLCEGSRAVCCFEFQIVFPCEHPASSSVILLHPPLSL